MKISVIIPIYNACKTINRTLDSIIENTNMNNIEVICVNDGWMGYTKLDRKDKVL